MPRDGSYLLYGQDRTLVIISIWITIWTIKTYAIVMDRKTLLRNRESWQLEDSFGSKIMNSSVM